MVNTESCPGIILLVLIALGLVGFGVLAPDTTFRKMRDAGWIRPGNTNWMARAMFTMFGGTFLLLALLITVGTFEPLIVGILSGPFRYR